ncbi:MAG: hypothetical protein ACTHLW_15345 [Verrucomicrobiota bacterium]
MVSIIRRRRVVFKAAIRLAFVAMVGMKVVAEERPAALAVVARNTNVILATLGSETIRESDFQQFVTDSYAAEQASAIRMESAQREAALEAYLDLRVMVAKARKDGIPELATFKKAQELMRMKLLVGALNQRDYEQAQKRKQTTGNPAEATAAEHQNRIQSLRVEMQLLLTPLASTNVSLLNISAVPQEGVLATLGGVPLCESDFQWFLRDAYRAEQRMRAFSRPGARAELLEAFLDLRVLEAKARKEGLDQSTSCKNAAALMEMKLLAEFLRERDRVNPWNLRGDTDEGIHAFQEYINRLRTELDLKLIAPIPPQ